MVEHCTGVAEVTGSIPFQALISQLLKCVHNYDDHSSYYVLCELFLVITFGALLTNLRSDIELTDGHISTGTRSTQPVHELVSRRLGTSFKRQRLGEVYVLQRHLVRRTFEKQISKTV